MWSRLSKYQGFKGLFYTSCWMLAFLLLGLSMVSHPVVVLTAARKGLQIWWNIVLPSLFPFFIISEMLMSLGFVRIVGAILEPAMRPLFNLPGCGAFILGVSYLSGFPLCAILTSRLRQENLCSRNEGERLMAFTSNASPLFMLGAVASGMLANPVLGPFIAIIHYLSNFLCGIILKYLYRQPLIARSAGSHTSLSHTISSLSSSSKLHKVGFGHLFGEIVRNTTMTLLAIGGFITFFSVLISLLQSTGVLPLALRLLLPLVHPLGISSSLLQALITGFFEMTLGISEVCHSSADLFQQLLAIEAILAWNGLAVQAQVAGMVVDSGLSVLPYLATRLMQIPLALALTCLLINGPFRVWTLPVFQPAGENFSPAHNWLCFLLFLSAFFLAATAILLALHLIAWLRRKVIIIR